MKITKQKRINVGSHYRAKYVPHTNKQQVIMLFDITQTKAKVKKKKKDEIKN